MKRPLLFFVVLAAGSAALYWADRVSRSNRVEAAEGRPVVEEGPSERVKAEPRPPLQDDDPPTQLKLNGYSELFVFPAGLGVKRKTHHVSGTFEAQDERGLRYLVRDVRVTKYDDAGALTETIEAARARVQLVITSLDNIEIANAGHVAFEQVVITRLSGHVLAPLVFEADALDVYLTDDRIESVDDIPVTVTGVGMQASGRGLLYEGGKERLTLERGGEVQIDRGGEDPVRFLAPSGGPLVVARVGEPEEGRLELRATKGGQLLSRGVPQTQVDAERMTLRGVARGGSFVVQEGEASGEVVAVRGPERYQGDSASLFLDGAGHVTRAVMDEEPLARLRIIDDQGQESFVIAQGKGPLTTWLDGEAARRFVLIGPGKAHLEGEGLEIEAAGRLEGYTGQAAGTTVVLAREGVEVRDGDSRIDTESLDATFLPIPGAIDLWCVGQTRLTGRDELGAVVTVDISDHADVRARGGLWVVAEARGIEAHALGAQPFRASAGLVRNLDPVARSMELEGGVSWVGVFGEADASRAVLTGPGEGVLYGIPGSPARLRVLPQRSQSAPETELELVRFSALTLDVTSEKLEATDEVQIVVAEPDRRVEIDAADASWTLPQARRAGDPRPFSFTANQVTRFEISEGAEVTTFSCGRVLGGGTVTFDAVGRASVELTWAVASEGVIVAREGAQPFHAEGDRLVYQGGAARLTPRDGERIAFHAEPTEQDPAWRFEADALVYGSDQVHAERPTARFEGALIPAGRAVAASLGTSTIEARRLLINPSNFRFEGSVLAQGRDLGGIPVTIESEVLVVNGAEREPGVWDLDRLESFEATGGFRAVYGGLALARSERCFVDRGRMILEGTVEREAVLDLNGIALRSVYLEIDLDRFLITSGRGSMTATAEHGGWHLTYAALAPHDVDGETVVTLVAPHYSGQGEQVAQANFTGLWIHADTWRRRGHELLGSEPRGLEEEPAERESVAAPPPRKDLVQNVFTSLMSDGELQELIKAAHIEGSLEVTEHERTVARASEAWIDLERQHGWLRDATLVARMDLSRGDRQDPVRVRAKEVVTRGDGSLRAQNATLTTSTHEVPGYLIRTGELILMPREDGMWSFSAKPNRIKFRSGISLPLPPLGSLVLDDTGDFVGFETADGEVRTIENLTIGDTARGGTTVGGKFSYPIGRLGKRISQLFGFDGSVVRGDWSTEASYLSDRGVLVGTGLELRERKGKGTPDEFWFNLYMRGIVDGGDDLGLLRVDEVDRDDLRSWINGRGRYPFGPKEWLELQFSTQSDPGVQAEFYEREYLVWEQRENDIFYRKASGASYFSARVEGRIDSYRTEVEELPAAGFYGGETPIAKLGSVPLLWGKSLDVAYLRRQQGNLEFEDPFFDTFGQPDPHGEREVLRAATEQRLSAPIKTGLADIVATPWLAGQFVAWDEGIDEQDAPHRATLLGGVDLATVLMKRTQAGYLHTLSPTLHVRGDLAHEEEDGLPVRFDALEDSPEGDEVGVGLRALWSHADNPNTLDVAVRALQVRDRGVRPDQDQIELLGSYYTEALGRPFGLLSDLRLDPADGDTIYGRSTIAYAPTDDWILELSHRRGRGVDGLGLFETASFDTRYRLDEKWELQLGQDVNMIGSGTLRSEAIIRRYGADFLFELQVLHRAGEGSTVRVNFAPLFAWKRRPLGILEQRTF